MNEDNFYFLLIIAIVSCVLNAISFKELETKLNKIETNQKQILEIINNKEKNNL